MNRSEFKYQPNLSFREFTIPSGNEWSPQLNGWGLIHIGKGTGYCLQSQTNRELSTGTVLLLAGDFQGSIRASQLGELRLCSVNIIPERLTGLLTLNEQQLFKLPPEHESFLKILPADNPAALKTSELFADKSRRGFLFRLKLLQIFAELFLEAPHQAELLEFNADASDALKRLKTFLKDVPASELMELDINDLAERTHCTPRHLNRIFFKLVGMSFTDKRAELRLEKARELLMASNSKVVQVALDSGYNSLSQFNLMFTRRYGLSPGKWRRKNGYANVNTKVSHKQVAARFSPSKDSRPDVRVVPALNPSRNRGNNGNVRSSMV
jgi:AraC-like DNA-binding protein